MSRELKIKKRLYDDDGYILDFKLGQQELETIRRLIKKQFFEVLEKNCEEHLEAFKRLDVPNYHKASHLIDHSKVWPKPVRCLPQDSCNLIKELPFWSDIQQMFAPFMLGHVVYERQVEYARDEMYWRIVRPGQVHDVGTLHADRWFHESMNIRERCYPEHAHALKIWIPIYVEPGLSGLEIVEGSHKSRDWTYNVEDIGNTLKPRMSVDETTIAKKLLEVEAGNMVIFNEDLVHVGAVNRGDLTRVSLEITLVKTHC